MRGTMGAKAHEIAQAAQAELEARPTRNVGVQTKERGMAKLSDVEVLEHEVHSRGKQGDARENVKLRKQLSLFFEVRRAEEAVASALEQVLSRELQAMDEDRVVTADAYGERILALERELEVERGFARSLVSLAELAKKGKVDRIADTLRKAEREHEANLQQLVVATGADGAKGLQHELRMPKDGRTLPNAALAAARQRTHHGRRRTSAGGSPRSRSEGVARAPEPL